MESTHAMNNLPKTLRISLAVIATVFGSASAFAQGQPATTPGAAPGTTAQVPPRAPTPGAAPGTTAQVPPRAPTPAATGAATTGLASTRVKGSSTPEVARRDYAAKLATRQSACTAKGALYRWKAPHNVGDAIAGSNPVQYWATTFNGGCVQVGLKDALASGAVRLAQ
jgi:hypothetical protein